jgi:hypothetical protein
MEPDLTGRIPDRFKCFLCDFICTSRIDVVKHVNDLHEKVTLTCPECCEEVFFLNTHMKEHGKTSGNASDVSDISASLNSGERNCILCNENFENDFLLKIHRKRYHPKNHMYIPCKICFKMIISERMRRHLKEVHKLRPQKPNNQYSCNPCDKTFSTDRDLGKHVMYYHERRLNTCPFCFSHEVTDLRKHVRYNHPDVDLDMIDTAEDDCRLKFIRAQFKDVKIFQGEFF